MKECPECSMFNGSNDSKCKYCGANLGSGGAGLSPSASEKKREDPMAKEAREKEEKKKKLITYAGYGLIAAAAAGWLGYTYWKKSKEPPPEKEPAAQVAPEDEATPEITEEKAVKHAAGVEEAIPKLGKRVDLDAGFSITPFDKAIIEGPGDEANPDTSKIFVAASKDGTVTMAVRKLGLPSEPADLTGALGAKLQSEYISSKGKFVAMPGKKQGKTALGDFIMFEADLGDTFERAYYILTTDAMVEMIFAYPAKDKKTGKHEAMIDEIFSSIKKQKQQAPAVETKPEAKPAEKKVEQVPAAKTEKPAPTKASPAKPKTDTPK